MQHLQPNTTLQGGKYRIERVLGQGGFGITYLARNTVFDIDVAIKEFFMKDENDRDGSSVTMPNTTKQELFYGQMEKFKKEAKRMFAIKNEHIIGVQDLFEENGTAYYVMDYVDGENLAERLKRTGKPMTEQEVREILPQILDALKSVHDAGIWHLDLKPANIMVDKSGKVKLIDFGASKQLNAQKGGATTSTAISYTNGYAPREQMEQNYDKFGPWTDIYALGATLYNLLTNKRPPLPTDIDDDMSEDKHNALPFPESVGGMKYLVLQMMKTNRLQRPQSIDNVLIALHQIQTNRQQEPSGVTAKILDDENTIIANHQDETDSKKDIEVQEGKIKKGKKKLVIYVSSTILLFLLITIIGYNEFQDYCLSKIRISEVVTNNTQSIVDEYGKHPAWIELVNTNLTPINIGGLYITSDRSCLDRSMNSEERIKHMSMIGDVKISSSSHELFYCNSDPSLGSDHLSLEIPMSEPVWIALYDKTASHIIDSVTIPALAANQSYRRINNMWVVTPPYNVTPGTTNIE